MLYISSFDITEKECGIIEMNGPIRSLGMVKDIKGQLWHIRAIVGEFVNACKEQDLHPYYKSTSSTSFGLVHQTWNTYKVVVAPF